MAFAWLHLHPKSRRCCPVAVSYTHILLTCRQKWRSICPVADLLCRIIVWLLKKAKHPASFLSEQNIFDLFHHRGQLWIASRHANTMSYLSTGLNKSKHACATCTSCRITMLPALHPYHICTGERKDKSSTISPRKSKRPKWSNIQVLAECLRCEQIGGKIQKTWQVSGLENCGF